jgi:hypothetical protein
MFPWVPKEPWTAGHETVVALGPKGLVVSGLICYDMNLPEASSRLPACLPGSCRPAGLPTGLRGRSLRRFGPR